jgi:hypothetical protein
VGGGEDEEGKKNRQGFVKRDKADKRMLKRRINGDWQEKNIKYGEMFCTCSVIKIPPLGVNIIVEGNYFVYPNVSS